MHDIAEELAELLEGQEPFALAVIAKTWRSSPRPVGTFMAVTADGAAIGSLSGGCIEGAVYETAMEVIASGGSVGRHYGVSGADALRVGLTCGGEIDVTISRVDPTDASQAEPLRQTLAALAEERPVVFAQVVTTDPAAEPGQAHGRWLAMVDGQQVGSLGSADLDGWATGLAGQVIGASRSWLEAGSAGDELLVCAWAPPPRLVVFGAIDFARAVTGLGKFLGYHVVVCDARPVFATAERLPEADEVVVSWPHKWLAAEVEAGRISESTVILVLTHDPKFDIPALQIALRSRAGFVGALGSRKTTRDREVGLREVGMTEAEIARLRAPVGLDISAETPRETAVSIMAEVIAARSGAPGGPLAGGEDSIHRPAPGLGEGVGRPVEC